ncbi:MAG: uroporphyrinogen-III synthase [Tannerella sp.]|jgi:uroporphyrinogen-III synthase|nr:uroporphyrinogen-III synthase [Tannerella sp.]
MAVSIKKLLVSQPKPETEKSPYYDIAERYGVEIDFRPFIKVEPLSAKEFRQQRINILDFTAIVFTARTAIDHFFNLCDELRIIIPENMKYFCMTEAIAVYLQKYIVYRKRKIFFAQSGKTEDLAYIIGKHSKEKYLIPVSDVHKDDLMKLLNIKKIKYVTTVMYRTVSNDFTKEEKFDYDMLVFFSPAGIGSLLKNFPDFKQDGIKIGCFGPATAKAAINAGLHLDLEAPTPEAPSMTAALELFLKRDIGEHNHEQEKGDIPQE